MNGQELAAAFWAECVAPALAGAGVDGCGAALLGWGSEVLGFDDDRSTDHNFGPRLQVFLPAGHHLRADAVVDELDAALPDRFLDRPVRYPLTTDAVARHRVEVTTVPDFCATTCGIDPTTGDVAAVEWLRAPTQQLAMVTDGPVFADPTGALTAARHALAWYPDEVWRYVLGCQWHRLAQEEAFIGRTAEVGDDLGSRLVAARLARDLVRLGFLLERRWAPYGKWLGRAFAQLPLAAELQPHLDALVGASTWNDRQRAYAAAAHVVAVRTNVLGLVDEVDPAPRPYFDRPFLVIDADRFAHALVDGSVLRSRGWRGAVDQWVDSTDALGDLRWLAAGDDVDDDLELEPRLLRPVTIDDHHASWPSEFDELASRLADALGPLAVRIDHIGSTAVPGLPAKDVIDAQVVVSSLQFGGAITEAFAAIGFRRSPGAWNQRDAAPRSWTGPPDAWDKLVFAPADPAERAVNVHVRVDGGPNARRALLFRDHLRADADARDEWGRLKRQIARRVRHLAAYGQVKGPATELLLDRAERWAADTGWTAPTGPGR